MKNLTYIKPYDIFLEKVINDNAETLTYTALNVIKTKLEKMFDYGDNTIDGEIDSQQINNIDDNHNGENINTEQSGGTVSSIAQATKKGKEENKNMSFKEMNLVLDSCEISKYAVDSDSLILKYSDDNFFYNLELFVYFDDVNKIVNSGKDVSYKDVQDCFIKFKKYDCEDFKLIGQMTKNIKLDDINEDFLIELKVEFDDIFSDEKDNFEIEM